MVGISGLFLKDRLLILDNWMKNLRRGLVRFSAIIFSVTSRKKFRNSHQFDRQDLILSILPEKTNPLCVSFHVLLGSYLDNINLNEMVFFFYKAATNVS